MAEGEHGPTTISEGHHAVAAVGTLVALTLASFAYVVAEALPIGLLPQIADDLGVTPSAVGLLVTGHALVVAATAVPLTRAVSRAGSAAACSCSGSPVPAASCWPPRRFSATPRATTTIAPVMLSAALAALAALGTHHMALLVILVAWGAAMAALPSTLQTRVLTVAPMNTPTASSVYVAVFNGGIACGALLGAALLDHGDLALLPVAGAVLALLAVPPAILSRARPDLTA